MRAYELIQRKRDGGELSEAEIRWLIGGFVREEIPDAQMAAWLMAVYFRGLNAAETASLTLAMVDSGRTLDLRRVRGRTVDKHSTGGVGDKTSLVVVPLVASAGVRVAKLSGRGLGHTGGTLDKLESIPGFRIQLSPDELIDQVNRVGCAIVSQSQDLVPADKRLYALRDITATVGSVPLIASSVMSKKIAAGSEAIVLDVKAGSGAFMKTPEAARTLAAAMVEIGRAAGRRTVAVITAMGEPLGRAVGNALEVDEALRTLRGDGPPDLQDLCLALGAHMVVLAGLAADHAAARALLADRLRRGDAGRTFREMVAAQGGDPGVVDHPGRLPWAPIQRPAAAEVEGVVLAVDAEALGSAAMILGAGRARAEDRIDPAAGLVIERKIGEAVRRGEPLAMIHGAAPAAVEEAIRRVRAAYTIGAGMPVRPPLIYGVVS
ncbi:MAG TPA: thymidine phosphorylase [bacterium]|nr:thymidine phosphorylase [bacterium]